MSTTPTSTAHDVHARGELIDSHLVGLLQCTARTMLTQEAVLQVDDGLTDHVISGQLVVIKDLYSQHGVHRETHVKLKQAAGSRVKVT